MSVSLHCRGGVEMQGPGFWKTPSPSPVAVLFSRQWGCGNALPWARVTFSAHGTV